MKSVLMYHEGSRFERDLLLPWLASFTEVVGVIVVENRKERKFDRLKSEYRRSGALGILDTITFRAYDILRHTDRERKIKSLISDLEDQYPTPNPKTIHVESPNREATEQFLREREPDIAIARIKLLLDKRIFSIPSTGTFAIHPGICPEYRNAHGCFWAIVEDDHENVGYTLLKIDQGIDTGPIYAQGGTEFDPTEDYVYIQQKVIADNLDEIKAGLEEAHEGSKTPLDVSGREDGIWGQPKFTDQVHRCRQERKRKETANRTLCLLYHDIVPDKWSDTSGLQGSSVWRYKLPPPRFESHLQRIAKQDAPTRTIDECPPHQADGGIYLTFDDGGRSIHKHAAPILKEFGVKGHLSIITNRIGEDEFLNAQQIRNLSKRGHHIMSHTVTHPDLITCNPSVLSAELERSKATLEEITGQDCITLSVPSGQYNEEVLQAAWDAGYEFVFTSNPIANPETQVFGRWNIWNWTTPKKLESILHQDWIVTGKVKLRWELLNNIKSLVGKKRFIRMRDRLIS